MFLCFFAFLSIPLHSCFLIFTPFFSSSFLCFPSGIQKLAKLNTFEWSFLHKKPSLSNSQFGFQVVILQKCSKWTVLSGQLFIQLLFIPPLTKERGSFFLCWTSRIWLLRKFFVRKSGTLRWHMEKSPACFFVFLHLYPFLFIPVFSYLFLVLLFIPLFPFKFSIWVLPSRDPPKMFNMNSFRWTVVYTIALHSSTDQSRGLLFLCWISRIWLLRKSFVRKSGTLRWHMEKHLHVSLFFCISIHSSSFLLFDSYSFFLLFIPLFPFRDPISSQTGHFWVDLFAQKTFPFKFPIGVPSRDPPKMFKMNSFKWTVVYTIALHSSTDQSKGLLFFFAGSHESDSLESFLSENLEH